MPIEPTTGLKIPTLEEFATFKGYPSVDYFEVEHSQLELFLNLSADLLILRTGLKKAPDPSTPLGRIVSYGIMDLAWFLGTSQDEWTSMFSPFSSERIGSYAYCVDEETLVLTKEGWKSHNTLCPGRDVVYTLNTKTGMSEWQPLTDVHKFPAVKRDMLLVKSDRFNSLTTMEHSWATYHRRTGKWFWKKTKDFVVGAGTSNLSVPYNAPHADLPSKPTYSDDLVELVAWYWTEGSKDVVASRQGGGHIHQSYAVNSDKCAMIRSASTKFFGPKSESLDSSKSSSFCLQDGCENKSKARGFCNIHYMKRWRANRDEFVVPRVTWTESSRYDGEMAVFSYSPDATKLITDHLEVDGSVKTDFLLSLTKAQLELFIKVSALADGTAAYNKQLTQKLKPMAEQFALACILSGRRVSINETKTDSWCVGYGHGLYTKLHSFKDTVQRIKNPKNTKFEVVEHEGVVWCPETPNGTWLARRGGKVYFTGNSKSVSSAANKKDILDAPLFNEAASLLLALEEEVPGEDVRQGIGFSAENVFATTFAESERWAMYPGRH